MSPYKTAGCDLCINRSHLANFGVIYSLDTSLWSWFAHHYFPKESANPEMIYRFMFKHDTQ